VIWTVSSDVVALVAPPRHSSPLRSVLLKIRVRSTTDGGGGGGAR